jgi:hypothetical protein
LYLLEKLNIHFAHYPEYFKFVGAKILKLDLLDPCLIADSEKLMYMEATKLVNYATTIFGEDDLLVQRASQALLERKQRLLRTKADALEQNKIHEE